MKKISLLILVLLLIASACGALEESPYGSQDTMISITVKEGSVDRRAERLTLVIHNYSNMEYTTGAAFQIETERNGVWYQYPPQGDIAWIDIAYIIEPGGLHEETVSLYNLYGELSPGTYRVVKTFYHENGKSAAFGVFTVS